MQIHQFQASYQVEHDRILVRLNTQSGEELRLWLTRRMMKGLFPHLTQASTRVSLPSANTPSHDGASQNALAEFKKQEVLQQTDFATPFDSGAAVLPFGAEPLLTTAVHITPLPDDGLKLKFDETLPGVDGTRSIEFTLGPALLIGLLHVIEKVLPHTDWGFASGAPAELPGESNTLDSFAAAAPPKYLN